MASIVPRPKKDGITYQIKWRQDGAWQSENFGDEDQAREFKGIVEAHGNRWPPGWVRGKGFVDEEQRPGDMPFETWAHRVVDRLTGIDERTRGDYRRDIVNHFSALQHVEPSGRVAPATICNITADDVQDWIRAQETGERDPDNPARWLRRPAGPKSIANRHGLLSSIVQAAVDAEPPLRTKNCCKKVRLPRIDDHTVEEMTFLEPEEYARIRAEITFDDARDLTDWLVGTGMRWGEATALQVRDVDLKRGTVSVQRAWKRKAPGEAGAAYWLGPPKTRRARRVVALTAEQLAMVRRRVAGKPPEGLIFETPRGKAWRHTNFWRRRWLPAVEEAIAKGLPKRPRIHDLRHTHVAWLIAAGVPLPAIQARLGHESITTTVDRYGHLVRSLSDDITAAVENAMSPPAAGGNVVPLPTASQEA